MGQEAEKILTFWLEEIGPAGWYAVDEDVDERIRSEFGEMWSAAKNGAYLDWLLDARSALALIILLDQFPRNMFRGSGEAFSSDRLALRYAKASIDKGYDNQIDKPERQFFYLPLMHSESIPDQERCVRLMRLHDMGENLLHSRAHREVIRKFSRFPYRNDALGRDTSSKEAIYLEEGGYSSTLNQLV